MGSNPTGVTVGITGYDILKNRRCAMLVLARKDGQAVVIDGKTTITFKITKRRIIRLVIDAPDEVRILRKELVHQDGSSSVDESK